MTKSVRNFSRGQFLVFVGFLDFFMNKDTIFDVGIKHWVTGFLNFYLKKIYNENYILKLYQHNFL